MYNQQFNNFNNGYPQSHGQQSGYNNDRQIGFNGYNGQRGNGNRQFMPSNKPRPQDFPVVSHVDEYVRQTWENMIATAKPLLDTSALMAYRSENLRALFQELIYSLFVQRGIKFYIMEETWLEIKHLAVNADKEESRIMAANVRRYLEACVVNGIIVIIKGVTENPSMIKNGRFADASILSYAFDDFAHGGNLCVITRDNKLALDLKSICQARCVSRNMGTVRVLYLDTKLKLKDYQVDRARSASALGGCHAPDNGFAGNRISIASENDYRDEPEKASTEKGRLTDLPANNLYELNGSMKAPTTNAALQMVTTNGSTTVTLGERIGGGKEGGVYKLKEGQYRNYCAKIFEAPSSRVEKKVQLMIHNTRPNDSAALPQALLYKNSVFCGYVMPLYSYAISLANVLDGKAGDCVANFTRVDFVMAANRFLKVWNDLDMQGIRIVDLNPYNILFVPQNGEFSGTNIVIVDLDSAQVDSAKLGQNYGVIPAGGFCPGFIDYALGKFTRDTILSESNMVMALAQAIFRICCVGLHPFDVVSDKGADMSLDQYAEMGIYLYTSRYPRLAGYSVPKESTYMVSYLTPGLKEIFADLFHLYGKSRNVSNRPPVQKLISELENYGNNIRTLRTQQRFPQSISLQPTEMHVCQGDCGNPEELVLNDTLFKFNNRFYCKTCYERIKKADGINRVSAVNTTQPGQSANADHQVQRRSGVFGWLHNRKNTD